MERLVFSFSIFINTIMLFFLPSSSFSASMSIMTDKKALLMFRRGIQKDPSGVLSSWNPKQSPCNNWYGVSCRQGRVTQIDLGGSYLSGLVSFCTLSSIESLVVLDLSSNSLSFNSTSNLLRLPRGLEVLDLSSSGAFGSIPHGFLSRYQNLTYCNLSNNNISGFLPLDLPKVSEKLEVLDLSFNGFSGPISDLNVAVSNSCSGLNYLDLSGNRFSGELPPSLPIHCSNLKSLNLSSNDLVGNIPISFGEFRGLQKLDLSHNHLTSSIPFPPELGWKNTCRSLLELRLSDNNISGSIPVSLSSCSLLRLLDLANNNVSGRLPEVVVRNLTSLESLLLGNNLISGRIPSSLASCKNLRIADLSSNKFTGFIPAGLCSSPSTLEEFRLPDNFLTGEIPSELGNCSNLRIIDFSLNFLKGRIPAQLGQLQNLEQLMVWFNGLSGSIPSELCRYGKLKNLILNNNGISGEIPTELFSCTSLEWVALTSNRITGRISPEFSRLSRLAVLQLGNNSLAGDIPIELGKCTSLVWLDLNSNRLTGEIPARLGRQLGADSSIGILSGNTLAFVRNVGRSCKGAGGLLEFAGIRPERLLQVPTLKTCDFTRLYSGEALNKWTTYHQTLEYLDLSYNNVQGRIPAEFGDMIVLQVLDLAHNKLSGEIPDSIGRLKNIGVFDVAHNRLQGSIPESFSNLSFLVQIDVSNNMLTGQIPARGQLITLPASQFSHNPGLCGVPLPPCPINTNPPIPRSENSTTTMKKRKKTSWVSKIRGVVGVLILSSMVIFCALMICAVAVRVRKKEEQSKRMLNSLKADHSATTWMIGKEKEPLSINVATFQTRLRKLRFSQLIEATNGFSAGTLIGFGGFGEVFKATLKDGSTVAVKKLIRLSNQGDREFTAEMETLGKINHKNLVPLLGYCKVGEERLLVYDYMKFGSLEEMLHGGDLKKKLLSWDVRKKIAVGAAKGLCFLHHNCIPHIIHRDVKSSNVLLDENMDGRVSDFGMARLISALDTHLSVTTLAGTPGYVPPEYYQRFRCSSKGDVYSFGVVLLEIVTGKRPTHKEEFGETNLVGWVKIQAGEGKGRDLIDPEILGLAGEGKERDMLKFLEIGMMCVDDLPSRRPTMLQVVATLKELVNGGNV